jgi:exosortase E/protease (VPEID-CTERM system)
LAALLLAELMVLSLRFDSGSLHQDHHWWANLVRSARFVPQLVIVIALAVVVLGRGRWSHDLRLLLHGQGQASSWWLFLLGHLLAFGAFFHLTAVVLEGDIRSSAHPEFWVLTWFGLGLLTGALWAGAVLPPGLWRVLMKRAGGLLLLGGVVGGLALWAGQLTTRLWEPLGQGTMWLVYLMLSGLFPDVVWLPDDWVIGTSRFHVEIAWQCSGYEGIGLIWIVLVFYLWFFRTTLRFPQALLLLPLGTAVMWLANAVRIVALIAVGNVARDVALAGFHSQAGWIAFNVVVLGLVAVTRQSRFFTRADGPAMPAESDWSTVAFLAPIFVILATTSLTGAFAVNVDWLYPVRVLAGAVVLWVFRRHYANLGWGVSWTAVAIGIGVFFLWIGLHPALPQETSPDLLALGKAWGGLVGVTAWLLMRALGSVVIIPLAEELAFRGYLTRRLQAADFQEIPLGRFTWFSFLASSILFGALHSQFLAGTLAGLAYALALYRRGRIGDAVAAHATTNALLTGYVLLTGRWSLWN